MISCVRALVFVTQQGIWRGCCSARPRKENTGSGSSECCSASAEKSMVFASRRGGVPVFSRPTGSCNSRNRAASALAGGSPIRPPGECDRPTWILPLRKVPAVSTTARAAKRMPSCVTTPVTHPLSTIRSSHACANRVRFGWFSSRVRIACRYRTRSACARVARTAGPFEALRMRNWMPASSVAAAIAPSSASTSLTRCPLPMPPIAGLQLIAPSVSRLCVSSSVFTPMRALASAASAPAWPPPTTITSKRSENCIKSQKAKRNQDLGKESNFTPLRR